MATPTLENASQVSDVLSELDAADQFETPPEDGATWRKWVFRLALLGRRGGAGHLRRDAVGRLVPVAGRRLPGSPTSPSGASCW